MITDGLLRGGKKFCNLHLTWPNHSVRTDQYNGRKTVISITYYNVFLWFHILVIIINLFLFCRL